MKILVFLTILTFSLAGVGHAGLDSDGATSTIAVYHFDTLTTDQELNSQYTDDSGPGNVKGFLIGASITNGGKFDKCLQLQESAKLLGAPMTIPSLLGWEFSIVAWIKLQNQTDASPFIMIRGVNIDFDTNTIEKLTSISMSVAPTGNVGGKHTNFTDDGANVFGDLGSVNSNTANNKWHHIAFTKYANTYTIFLDGEFIAEQEALGYGQYLVGDMTQLIIGIIDEDNLIGSVYFDDVGFFQTGFSIYEIKGLYNDGLADFLETMPVDPQGKVATTWGEIKFRR